MTEQEAKEILSLTPEEKAILPNLSKVYEIAIQALEDIQKYRTNRHGVGVQDSNGKADSYESEI